jgi:hypothetical protein
MNPHSRPTFDREAFFFFRREHAGYASVISPEDPSKALHVLNPTVAEIGELCTGAQTIEEIRAAFCARYDQPPTSPLARYVDEAVFMLSLYNLVSFELTPEEPRVAGDPIPRVRRLEEWDLAALRELFTGGAFPAKPDVPEFHFKSPYVVPELYSELLLRLRLFQQREFFYAITTGERVDFAVSFFDERPLKPMASLATVVGSRDYPLEEGLAAIFPVLVKDGRDLLHKLEVRTVAGLAEVGRAIAALERLGFAHEATIIDEFGPGRHEEVWGLLLNPAPPASAETAAAGHQGVPR